MNLNNKLPEKQKVPNNLKEHVLSYLADLKEYYEVKKILKNNRSVYICKKCNKIYPLNHGIACDTCNDLMDCELSRNVTVSIPSRKDKYKRIKQYNEKIDEEAKINEKIKILNENEKIRKRIESMLYELNINFTDELLEYLIKIKNIDDYYNSLNNQQKMICGIANINEFINSKIRNKINNKLFKIYKSSEKISLLQSYLEEIKYCISRFPEYSKELKIGIIKVENSLDN